MGFEDALRKHCLIPALVTAALLNLLHRLAYTATRCRQYDGINQRIPNYIGYLQSEVGTS